MDPERLEKIKSLLRAELEVSDDIDLQYSITASVPEGDELAVLCAFSGTIDRFVKALLHDKGNKFIGCLIRCIGDTLLRRASKEADTTK